MYNVEIIYVVDALKECNMRIFSLNFTFLLLSTLVYSLNKFQVVFIKFDVVHACKIIYFYR